MSLTKFANLSVGLLMVAVALSTQAQTLGELAEMQRQRLEADNKPKQEAPIVIKATPKPRKEVAVEPLYSLHAIYTRKGKLLAEVTDGNSLVTVGIGFQVGKFKVLDITESAIVVRDANSSKSIPVGGRF